MACFDNIVLAVENVARPDVRREPADLPPPDVRRWGIRRKAAVVRAIENRVLSFAEACERYDLSAEELGSWIRRVHVHGAQGLRVTRLTDYRALERNPAKPDNDL